MRNRILVCLATVLLFLAAGAAAQSARPLTQVATIALPDVEGRIDHMAYDATSGRLYVAALGNNSVEVIDTKQTKVIHSIAGLANPQGISIAADAHKLFVANAKDGACRVFDERSLKLIDSVDLKSDADNVRFDMPAKRIYVGYGDGALAVLDAVTGNHVSDIKLPAHPESFQLESKGGRIFVNLPEADGAIAVVDRDQGKVLQTWPIREAKGNFPMALDEAGHRLFVGCRKPAKLVVIDTETGKAVDEQDCAGDTDDVWYDAAAARVYLSGGAGLVSVFSLENGRIKSQLEVRTAPGARTSLFAPETGMLYVAVPHRGNQHAEIRVFATR